MLAVLAYNILLANMRAQRNNRNNIFDERTSIIVILGLLLAVRMFLGFDAAAEPFKNEIKNEEAQIENQYKLIQQECHGGSIDYDEETDQEQGRHEDDQRARA